MRESVLEIVKNYQMRILVMAQKKYEEVLDTIIRSSVHVRFVGAIGSKGELLAYKRRAGLKPRMDAEKKPEFMPGVPPNLSNPPTGCRFASRCPQVMEKCSKDVPEFHTKSGFVKCWLYESL